MHRIQQLCSVVHAPENRHGLERLVLTNHLTHPGFWALAFGSNPVLEADLLAAVPIRPAGRDDKVRNPQG